MDTVMHSALDHPEEEGIGTFTVLTLLTLTMTNIHILRSAPMADVKSGLLIGIGYSFRADLLHSFCELRTASQQSLKPLKIGDRMLTLHFPP